MSERAQPLAQPITRSPFPLTSPLLGKAHILKLAVELLTEIFSIIRDAAYLDSHHRYMSWAQPLALTCRSWHAVVIGTPSLWSNMAIKSDSSRKSFSTWLERTGSAPIKLALLDRICTPTGIDILRILTHTGSVKRLTKLALMWDVGMRGAVCGFIEYHLGQASALTRLSLTETRHEHRGQTAEMTEDHLPAAVDSDPDGLVSYQDGPSVAGILQLPHLPSLRKLTIKDIIINFTEAAHGLRYLHMELSDDFSYWNPPDSQWIFDLLRHCNRLRVLYLQFEDKVRLTASINTSDEIFLPDLQSIKIATSNDHGEFVRNIFSSLRLSPPTYLELFTEPDWDLEVFGGIFPAPGTAQHTRYGAATNYLTFVAGPSQFDLTGFDLADPDEPNWSLLSVMKENQDEDGVLPVELIDNVLLEILRVVQPSNIVRLHLDLSDLTHIAHVDENNWVLFWTAFDNLRDLTICDEETAKLYFTHLPTYAASMGGLRLLELWAQEDFTENVKRSWFINPELNDAAGQMDLSITIKVWSDKAGDGWAHVSSTEYGNVLLVVDIEGADGSGETDGSEEIDDSEIDDVKETDETEDTD